MIFTATTVLLLLLAALWLGSLLSLSSHPHWFIRSWDFPRIQIIVSAWLLTAIAVAMWCIYGQPSGYIPYTFLGGSLALTIWHGILIAPYTPLATSQAKSTVCHNVATLHRDPATIRIVISNVEMENDHFDHWVAVIGLADPDLMVVVEVDDRWAEAARRLIDRYPYRVIQPQDNWYGMMLLSRLPIDRDKVRFLVQDDVPSIDVNVRLASNQVVRVIGIHPRPPEPIRDNDATARDAEITLWGQEMPMPTNQ